MKYRHEWKHEISYFDMLNLLPRLKSVTESDNHTLNGKYEIRSLYFDNLYDKALSEKINGVNNREKFRIRYYNGDTSYIVLEKKSKCSGLCSKESAIITKDQALKIANGDLDFVDDSSPPLVWELHSKMQTEGLRGKTIVDYTRIPFVYGPGNVRITLDFNIRTGLRCTDFLNRDCITVPAGDSGIILEVKWDEYLPSVIRDIVQIPSSRSSAFSKYAACRIYD